MIGYAWSWKVQVQVMAVFGIEHAMNEYTRRKDFSKECWIDYWIGEMIDPLDFVSEEDFYNAITYKFEKIFDTTYKLVPSRNRRDYWLKT